MDSLPGINQPANPSTITRIVGIGASAGGLAALELFMEQVPPESGLAYVVVQHLDPTQKALLAELLQRVTELPVREAENRMRVEPNCVYIIPPNTELSVVDGVLNLAKPTEPRGLRLPINVLFSSLARDQGERAIAVILSGMGSDGTLGLQAIRALGGLTVVQQPDSAQFDSMPRSAIAADCADIIASPAELPARILAYTAQAPKLQEPGIAAEEVVQASSELPALPVNPLQSIFSLLRQQTRHDFSVYKPSTLHRRIERRMAIHGITTLALYAEFMQQNTQEIDLLFKELLIGVTSFFRDPAVWQQLADFILPELLARQTTEKKLRAWVVGCSTGEEAYSLAILFNEVVQRLSLHHDYTLQIFATDLNPDGIAMARRGLYPASISADVSAERLARFFSAHDKYYRISKNIRDMVLFAQHDVVLDSPFTKLNLLSCRNLMIYFDATLQRRLLPLFHYSLRPGGVLLLGSSETIGRFEQLFTPIESRLRLYLRQDNASNTDQDLLVKSFPPLSKNKKELPVPHPTLTSQPAENLQTAADQVLLQMYARADVVVNNAGDIVYISGRTGNYLEPAAGKANWNFYAMVREGLRAPLADALKQAATESEPVQLRGLQVQGAEGVQRVDVTVQAFREPAVLQGMLLIVFRDVAMPSPRRGGRKGKSLVEASHEFDLQQYQDEILKLREEAHASNEELQSTNEELQSTNEELQSANEELTTSKEEMQSMNEELHAINAELQTKLDDLALAESDMKNLLNSTDIAILFLDQKLNVRRYTEQASKIISVRESDIGRPLSDLTTILQYPTLQDDAKETLRTLIFSEKQISTADDRWYSVRIMPYRRLDNVIDGAVITFVDISATKRLESKLRQDLD
ncbi:chemotaxis protein CheB [Nitrosomonas sp.]|uniref:chemotaxis protein CheB n=1 Tax=Nitrosomonas sp. TaxID=42353 RepID=UPI0025F8A247|nr:chemotaxis protein CheB [Nitrosomonas sp.]MBY0483303.1 PAS domain-containing protein [Nitrosomonas sp.]